MFTEVLLEVGGWGLGIRDWGLETHLSISLSSPVPNPYLVAQVLMFPMSTCTWLSLG